MAAAKIDPEIAPLITELNRMGLVTTHSCQGHLEDGWSAYVTFALDEIRECEVMVGVSDGKPRLTIYWER